MNVTARYAPARARYVEELANAAAKWGYDVPDDPGIAELADGLAQAAETIPDDSDGGAEAVTHLAAADEHLRAVARLGGLLPLVVCHHLRLALQYEQRARTAVERSALPAI